MIQIRNIPGKLKARAATEGMSLSDYLLSEMRTLAAQPTWREYRERLHERAPVRVRRSPASLIRSERKSG